MSWSTETEAFYAKQFPDTTPNPCAQCPWRRDALPGHLGPMTAEEWCEVAHSEAPIACHMTIKRTDASGHGEWDDPAMRQCKGAAIFRGNISKEPRHPQICRADADYVTVFGWDNEFIDYHEGRGEQ